MMQVRKNLTMLGLSVILCANQSGCSREKEEISSNDIVTEIRKLETSEKNNPNDIIEDNSDTYYINEEDREYFYDCLYDVNILEKFSNETFLSFIDALEVEETYKDIIRNIFNTYTTDSYIKGHILHLFYAKDDIEFSYYMMLLLQDTLDNDYSKTSNFTLDDIKILDNRKGNLDINKHLYLLSDFTTCGDYKIYKWNIDNIGSNYFVINAKNEVVVYLEEYYSFESIIKEVRNSNCPLLNLEDVLKDNELDYKIKEEYTYKELEELTFDISKKMDSQNHRNNSLEDIIVVTIPSETGSWYTNYSEEGYQKYYILKRSSDYLFHPDSAIYIDILNENAYITLDKTGFYGLQYTDDQNGVYINLKSYIDAYDDIKSLEQFLNEINLKSENDNQNLKRIKIVLS